MQNSDRLHSLPRRSVSSRQAVTILVPHYCVKTDRLVSFVCQVGRIPLRRGPPERGLPAGILTPAFELVQEVGYAKQSVEGITTRAGVGKQTIYRWWPSERRFSSIPSPCSASNETTEEALCPTRVIWRQI
ncbi:helix-turn-helix domain-containing protein [Nonomuraea sp. NPDC052129]|uniref:TetR/AcrR family transcriptional regulator n=1 Tax=Nonomuraea sp. NPDC052129 TaxID=3154651 RepID=UPI00341FCA24